MSVNPIQRDELDELQREHEGFRVTDASSANWCLRKLQAMNAQERETNALADAEVQRIEAWREGQLEGVKRHREFFERLLMEWHQELLAQDPKNNKSVKLPYGTLKSVTRGPQPKKEDESALLAHIKLSGDTEFIKVVESVAWSEYKKRLNVGVDLFGNPAAIDENGELVPGVVIDLGGTTFKVEVSE